MDRPLHKGEKEQISIARSVALTDGTAAAPATETVIVARKSLAQHPLPQTERGRPRAQARGGRGRRSALTVWFLLFAMFCFTLELETLRAAGSDDRGEDQRPSPDKFDVANAGEHNDDKETVGENKTPARQEQDDVA